MLNYNYVREIINTILTLDELENIKLYYSINKNNTDELKLYTIYVNPIIDSEELNMTIENIYPLTHINEGIEYQYNNLTEEEISIISNILHLLNFKIDKVSIPELELIKKVARKTIQDSLNRVNELESEINTLEKEGLMSKAHKKSIEVIKIQKELNRIHVTCESLDWGNTSI